MVYVTLLNPVVEPDPAIETRLVLPWRERQESRLEMVVDEPA
jgi:hypothetical protein